MAAVKKKMAPKGREGLRLPPPEFWINSSLEGKLENIK